RLISIRGIWFGRRGVAMRKIASGFVAAQAINFSGTFPTNRKVRGEGLIHGGGGSGGFWVVIGGAAQGAFGLVFCGREGGRHIKQKYKDKFERYENECVGAMFFRGRAICASIRCHLQRNWGKGLQNRWRDFNRARTRCQEIYS